MSWLDELGKALQKPQSVFSGGLLGLSRNLGLVDPNSTYMADASNPLTGLLEGWKHQIHPHDLLNEGAGNQGTPNLASKIMNTIADIGVDPLMLAGPVVKAASPALKGTALGAKLVGAAEAAGSAEKLGEGLGTGNKLSDAAIRALRRTYQGTLATGNPLSGFGVGQLMGAGEKYVPKLAGALPRLLRGTAEAAPELSATLADEVPSAIQVAMKELGPGPRAAEQLALGPAIEGGIGYQGAWPMGAATGPVGPLNSGNLGGSALSPELSVQDMIDKMYGKGRLVGQDAIAEAFRLILQGQ